MGSKNNLIIETCPTNKSYATQTLDYFGGKAIGIHDMIQKINEEKKERVRIKSKNRYNYYGEGVNIGNFKSVRLNQPSMNESEHDMPSLLDGNNYF